MITLKGQAVKGVKWTGLSTLITSVFQYVQVAVLTKFLTPSDFGIMAMALVVIGLAQAYTDLGISNAIIQRQNPTKDNLSSLYWLEIMTKPVCRCTPLRDESADRHPITRDDDSLPC